MIFLLLLLGAVAAAAAEIRAKGEEEEDPPSDPDIEEILGDTIEDGGGAAQNVTIATASAPTTAAAVNPKVEDIDPGPNLMEDDEDEKKKLEEAEEKQQAAAAASNDTETDEQVFLPEEGAAEKEHSNSLAIFFVLSVLILCVFLVHFALQLKCHYIPESLAIVFLGAIIGLSMKILPVEDLKKVESFSPTMFFLVLLPPIIFESGYNLHKGIYRYTVYSITNS